MSRDSRESSESPIGFKDADNQDTHPLAGIRQLLCGDSHDAIADAVRWACVLEATAPKVGNVYPGKPFADLAYRDFVAAAETTAEIVREHARVTLCGSKRPGFGRWVYDCVQRVAAEQKTNVNLGILLLLGPLIETDITLVGLRTGWADWLDAMPDVMQRVSHDDGRAIFAAIAATNPGGMGSTDEMDVMEDQSHAQIDLVAAMRLAEDRDRIAKQYACAFRDFFETVVPVLDREIRRCGDILGGIARAHLAILSHQPDTLIARKHGSQIAEQVRSRAAAVDPNDAQEVLALDRVLRGESSDSPARSDSEECNFGRCNPGTTADLIAAGLYVLLRCDGPGRRP